MAGYNPNRPRRDAPTQVPGVLDQPKPEDPVVGTPGPDDPARGTTTSPSTSTTSSPMSTAPLADDADLTPAPATRLLPRHGLPDRILLVAGCIGASTALLALIAVAAWWRRHRITISRIGDGVGELLVIGDSASNDGNDNANPGNANASTDNDTNGADH